MQIFFNKMSKTAIELEIIELIRKKRKSNKLSQAKIAKILNVTPGYIGQIEVKDSPSMYSYSQLNQLAIYFDCSPREFIPEKPL
ncbi:helix-turn-helix domain-containing protein [Sphingobacterium mizutaii]|uniref:helix-turn-helix domain-containing protein n=1 Tax=Sphingobacterium mizutaii TaxID=1010 RepID=UPI00162A7C93|nr:helix-turn-helix transcriptional regulator [Sphingobacterium mizutaii]